jgi:hypothetical protein
MVGRDAEERGEKRRERRVEMNSNGLNEHWTASEARKKREIVTRKDERMNPKQYCLWIEDDDGVYQTSCLHSFEFMNGNPELNGIKFCPYCGKLIRQSKDGEL